MKFRKKPVVIEATQWFKNGDHPADDVRLLDATHGGQSNSPDKAYAGERHCEKCGQIMHVHGWIDTLEGGHIVCPGDWIITGVKGENYPCKPDIFESTYEVAE